MNEKYFRRLPYHLWPLTDLYSMHIDLNAHTWELKRKMQGSSMDNPIISLHWKYVCKITSQYFTMQHISSLNLTLRIIFWLEKKNLWKLSLASTSTTWMASNYKSYEECFHATVISKNKNTVQLVPTYFYIYVIVAWTQLDK